VDSHPADSSNTKTKLVEAKLEMVCAAGLFHGGAAVRPFRWLDIRGRLQRDEIDRCLEGRFGPRATRRRCDRDSRFTYQRWISRVGEHQRQRRDR
jgi:hypothetical protein